jgi:hypothetical protein
VRALVSARASLTAALTKIVIHSCGKGLARVAGVARPS